MLLLDRVMDQNKGVPRGFAFIHFAQREAAIRMFLEVGGGLKGGEVIIGIAVLDYRVCDEGRQRRRWVWYGLRRSMMSVSSRL